MTGENSSTAVVVLGMHRSGTSALAGLLSLLGVDLGARLHPPDRFNEAGYFEHLDVMDIHERMLRLLGSTWDDPRPLPSGWTRHPEVAALRADLLSVLKRDFQDVRIWAIKDPRLCRLWSVWEEILPELRVTVRFVLVARPPAEVAGSLARRDAMAPWRADLLYVAHNLAAEEVTRGRPRAFVTYDQLLADGPGTACGLMSALALPRPSPDLDGGIRGFLRKDLRHCEVKDRRVAGPDSWAERCYDAFDRAARAGRPPNGTMDVIASEFRAAAELFAPWVGEWQERHREQVENADALAAEIRAAREAHGVRDRREADLTRALAVRESEVAAAQAALTDREAEMAAARAALVGWEAEATATRAILAGQEAQIQTLREALESAEREARLLRENLDTEMWRGRHLEFALAQASEGLRDATERLDRLSKSRTARFVLRRAGLAWILGPPAVSQAPVHLQLDFAAPTTERGTFVVSGWCAVAVAPGVRRLRLRIGASVFEAELDLPRPDVARVFPSLLDADRSGFRIDVPLPLAEPWLQFEAEREPDAWEPAGRHRIDGPVAPLLAALDEPVGRVPAGQVRFRGWCVHPVRPIARLTLSFGSVTVECRYGLPRDDVGAHLPPFPGSGRSGFEATCLLEPGHDHVTLTAHLEGQGTEVFRSPLPVMVGGQKLPVPEGSGPAEVVPGESLQPLEAWMGVNRWNTRLRDHVVRRLETAGWLPAISVLVDGHGAPGILGDLENQLYGAAETVTALEADPRRAERMPRRGLAVRFRSPARRSSGVPDLGALVSKLTGDFVLLLESGVRLTPDALAEVALHVAGQPETDAVFSDGLEVDGDRAVPAFRSAFSPEEVLTQPDLGGLLMVRRELLARVLQEAGPGGELADLTLRVTDAARSVGHVPLALWRRPQRPGGAARGATLAQAVAAAWARRGIPARVRWVADRPGRLRHEFPDSGPTVTVLLSPGAEPGAVNAGLEALRSTRYAGATVAVVEAGDARTLAAARNREASRARTDYLLFLDGDLRPSDPAWLSHLMGYAQLLGVGVVGAVVVDPTGEVLDGGRSYASEGDLLACTDGPGPGCVGARAAVARGCLLTPRSLFLELGGFQAADGDAGEDVAYCERARNAGRRVLLDGSVTLVRHGARSPTPSAPPRVARSRSRKTDSLASPHVDAAAGVVRPRCLSRGFTGPIRALMCSFTLNREGAPASQYELTVRLKENGVLDPVVYCPTDGPLKEDYERAGIDVVVSAHPLAGVSQPEEYDTALRGFAGILEDRGVELVYGNTVHTFYAIDAANDRGLPSVWNIRESEAWGDHFAHFPSHIVARALRCFEYPYRVVFVAQATRAIYAALERAHNFTVIHNGLDLKRLQPRGPEVRSEARRSLGLAADEVGILLLGTVCARKGQLDLAQALALIPESVWERLRCFIVGHRPSIPYGADVKAAVDALPEPLRERVAVVDETHEPGRFYAAADVFVCSSRVESYPRVILEAMAYGLPIVTTPVFGIREQVRENVNALFYDPGDVASLGRALTLLLEHPERRGALAAQTRAVLEDLPDFDSMAAAYAEVFQEAYLSRGPAVSGEQPRIPPPANLAPLRVAPR